MPGGKSIWWPVFFAVFAIGFLAGAWAVWPSGAAADGAGERVIRALGALAMGAVGLEFLVAFVVALVTDD
jgi:hypothetical protein